MRKILRIQLLASTAPILMFGLISFPAFAERGTIDEVIVTSQKIEQRIEDVGASISVLGADALEFRDLDSVSDIAISIPNLNYGEVAGAAQITVRGIGLNVETGFAEPAVAVHLDGVYLGRSNAAALGFGDLASVEVLRGPQGTLYGRNATGGVLNFNAKKPTDAMEAGLTAGIGSFEAFGVRGHLSGPLSDALRARVFVDYKEDDGYIENVTTGGNEGGVENLTIRGALSWDVTDNLTADLSYLNVDQEWGGPSFEKLAPFLGFGTVDLRPNIINNDITPKSNIDMQVAALNLFWEGDGFTLRSITGYTTFERVDIFDGDQTTTDVLRSGRDEDADAITQEFNLTGSSFGGKLDWIGGAFYLNEDSTAITSVDAGVVGSVILSPNPPPNPGGFLINSLAFNQLIEELEAYGVFADITINVTDALRLKGGLRYSDETKSASQSVVNLDGLLIAGGIGFPLQCQGFLSEVSFDDVSPKGGIEYDVSESVMTYAQYQQGFKSGGFNQAGCTPFEPEEVDSYEIGTKGIFADGRGYFSLSGFHYDYTNLQVLQIVGGAFGFINNAASSSVNGLELEVQFDLAENFSVEFAGSWLDATYDSFIDGVNDFSGNMLSRAPEFTLFGGVEYGVPLGCGFAEELRLRGEVFWSDDVFFRPRNAAADMQESYAVANVYATISGRDDRYQIRGFVKNIGDEEYLQNVIALFTQEASLDGSYAVGRTWGVEVGVKFN